MEKDVEIVRFLTFIEYMICCHLIMNCPDFIDVIEKNTLCTRQINY